jgi:predicted CXXCH cytochrome family protein
MIVKKQDEICFTCHDNLAKSIKGGANKHSPVTAGECTKCHSPHKAKLKGLLLASTPGLCLTCHKDMREKMGKENVHSPAEGNCLTCHLPHVSPQLSLIVQPILELCGNCHDFARTSFVKSHLGIDPKQTDCRHCHNPHTSKDPKFFKDVMHPPFAARTCETCHIVDKQ